MSAKESPSSYQINEIVEGLIAHSVSELKSTCPASNFPAEFDSKLPNSLCKKIYQGHNDSLFRGIEHRMCSEASTVLLSSIQKSKYVETYQLKSRCSVYPVIHLHTCGCFKFEEAAAVLSQFNNDTWTRKLCIHVSFNDESSGVLLEKLVNALSPFHTFEASVGMRITSINRDNFDVIIHVLRRCHSNPTRKHSSDMEGEMKKKTQEIHALIGENYDAKSKFQKFTFDNIAQFPDLFGVASVDFACIRVTRGRVCSGLPVRLDLNGQTFSIQGSDLSSMLPEYTAWWDSQKKDQKSKAFQ